MILVLHFNTDRSSDEFDTLMTSLRALENISTTVHEVQGEQQRLTEIYLLGDTVGLDSQEMAGLPCVESIGQRRAPDRLAEAHVIEFRCVDREAGLDVAQAFPVGQLGEGHGPVLLGAGKRPDPVIAAIPVDDPRESSPWQEVHELSEQGLAGVHEHLLGETPKSAPSNSNRHHAFSLQTPQKSWLSKPAPLS